MHGFYEMGFRLDGSLDVYAKALSVSAKRAEIIANNLANVDTPNYKAKDIDFKKVMAEMDDGIARPVKTNDSHLQHELYLDDVGAIHYRDVPTVALDGNTVNKEIEVSAFAKNIGFYRANLTFINGSLNNLRKAIKGE